MGMRYCRGKEVGARMEMDLYDSIGMGETFLKSNIVKTIMTLKDKVSIAQEETISNIWNGTMFGDLD